MRHRYRGKVRDVYELDDGQLLVVASDRVSVHDVVLPTEVPGKGALLTEMSTWWFSHLRDIVPNHLVSVTDVPPELGGRAMRCTALTMLPVECVVRGYLAGGGAEDYVRTGAISGVPLPDGLVEGSRLPRPVYTPSSKAAPGEHDRPVTFDETVEALGPEPAGRIRELALALYTRAAAHLYRRGMILADTKFEFGLDADGRVVLADEAVTCDSSRLWKVDEWSPGRAGGQRSYDKQLVRAWARTTGWDRTPPGPAVPPEIVEEVRSRYGEVLRTVTAGSWDDQVIPRR